MLSISGAIAIPTSSASWYQSRRGTYDVGTQTKSRSNSSVISANATVVETMSASEVASLELSSVSFSSALEAPLEEHPTAIVNNPIIITNMIILFFTAHEHPFLETTCHTSNGALLLQRPVRPVSLTMFLYLCAKRLLTNIPEGTIIDPIKSRA